MLRFLPDFNFVMLYRIPSILIALTVHECAHAFAAYKMGDYTAKTDGRLSLNPLRHLDPIGTFFLLIFGFGWAKPVPVKMAYFKNPKKGMAICAAFGPLSNFLMAFIAFSVIPPWHMTNFNSFNIFDFFIIFGSLNLGLMVFNLLPIPPLDGSKIAMFFLPNNIYVQIARFERYSFFILMGLIYLGFLDGILDTVMSFLYSIISIPSDLIWSLFRVG